MSKIKNKKQKKIEILWSGGWDSTFMLCKLAHEYDIIQPYYIIFHRLGEEYEIEAIKKIFICFSNHKEISCVIKPVIFIPIEEIIVPNWLRSCWNKFKEKPYRVAEQYLFLAAFAMNHKGIAIGQERYYETPGHMTRLLYEKGHMKFTSDGVGYFNPKDCHKDIYALFGNAIYPVSLFSELMMKEKAEEWNCMDIMNCSHFCYEPIYGKPCGMCGPCKIKLRQHMDFLFHSDIVDAGLTLNYLKNNNLVDSQGVPLHIQFENYIRHFKFGCLFKNNKNLHKFDSNHISYFESILHDSKYKSRDC